MVEQTVEEPQTQPPEEEEEQVEALDKLKSLEDKKKDQLANRALASMVDTEEHKARIGERVTKNMTIDERAAAYHRGDSSRSPYRNTAKMMASPRRVKTPSPEIDHEAIK